MFLRQTQPQVNLALTGTHETIPTSSLHFNSRYLETVVKHIETYAIAFGTFEARPQTLNCEERRARKKKTTAKPGSFSFLVSIVGPQQQMLIFTDVNPRRRMAKKNMRYFVHQVTILTSR